MSTIAAESPRFRPIRPRKGILVAFVSLVSAVLFVLARAGTPLPFPTFQGACERLRSSGLPILPTDWFCRPAPWTTHASFVAASLLVGVALVLPCAILAATSRRTTALLPLLVAPAATSSGAFATHWWGTGWRDPVMNIALFAAPVVAISVAARGRRARTEQPGRVATAASAVICLTAATGVVFFARSVIGRHFALDGAAIGSSSIVPAAMAMAAFGVLLGTDHRWWPWSLAPVAVLLSMGPSTALIVGPEHLLDWSQFGIAVPLALIGLVCSAWRPLAMRLTSRGDRAEAPEAASLKALGGSVGKPRRPRRVRPIVVLNAVGVGMLMVSLVMFRADPLPLQISMALPTYLGERITEQDVRTKMDLRQAMTAMDTYRSQHGTYRGFDAATGSVADTSLAWHDWPLKADASGSVPSFTMSIAWASGRRARVAALSYSGTAFCLERTGTGGLTFGSSVGSAEPGAGDATNALKQAVARCGSTGWTSAAIRPFPIATLCDGMAPDGGYLICRMVQALSVSIMRQTKPYGS